MIYRSAVQTAPATASQPLPVWVSELLARQPLSCPEAGAWKKIGRDGLHWQTLVHDGHALTSVRVEDFLSLDQASTTARCAAAYDLLFQQLETLCSPHPIRLWNFIPRILDPLGDLPHRYMAFNAGRFEAFRRWHEGQLRPCFPTATGVGRGGRGRDDLLIHCLSATAQGTPVENPRQVSSYRYSKKYGPLPPCFARATRIDTGQSPGGQALLLVGGTASVRGEDSVTTGSDARGTDMRHQLRETFLNLAALIRSAVESTSAASTDSAVSDDLETGLLLGRYHQLRVYLPNEADLGFVAEQIESRFLNLESCEYVHADLCRQELLVEIEGIASIPGV